MQPATPNRDKQARPRTPVEALPGPGPCFLRAKFWGRGGLFILNGPGSQPKIDPREEWLTREETQRRIAWMLGADSPRLSGRQEGPRPGLGVPDVGTWGNLQHAYMILSFREGGRCGLGWAAPALEPGPGLLCLGSSSLWSFLMPRVQPTNRPILDKKPLSDDVQIVPSQKFKNCLSYDKPSFSGGETKVLPPR